MDTPGKQPYKNFKEKKIVKNIISMTYLVN